MTKNEIQELPCCPQCAHQYTPEEFTHLMSHYKMRAKSVTSPHNGSQGGRPAKEINASITDMFDIKIKKIAYPSETPLSDVRDDIKNHTQKREESLLVKIKTRIKEIEGVWLCFKDDYIQAQDSISIEIQARSVLAFLQGMKLNEAMLAGMVEVLKPLIQNMLGRVPVTYIGDPGKATLGEPFPLRPAGVYVSFSTNIDGILMMHLERDFENDDEMGSYEMNGLHLDYLMKSLRDVKIIVKTMVNQALLIKKSQDKKQEGKE